VDITSYSVANLISFASCIVLVKHNLMKQNITLKPLSANVE